MEADCINRAIHTLLRVYLCYFLGFVFFDSFLSWGLEDALSSFPLPLLFLFHRSFMLVNMSEIRDAVSSANTKKSMRPSCSFFFLLIFILSRWPVKQLSFCPLSDSGFLHTNPSLTLVRPVELAPKLRSGLFVCQRHFRWSPATITFLVFSLK